MAFAILLFFVVFTGRGVYMQYFDTSSFRAKEAILYRTADETLQLRYPGSNAGRIVTGLPAAVGDELHASPNGRWIACTLQNGAVYVLDLAPRIGVESTAIEAVKVAEQAAEPAVFSEDSQHLVYLNKKNELYVTGVDNLAESWQLDTSVAEVVAVEEKNVLYTRYGEKGGKQKPAGDAALGLYLSDLRRDGGEWHVIDRSVVRVLDYTQGFQRLLYLSLREDEEEGESHSLMLFELGDGGSKGSKSLADQVGEVLDASADGGSAIYLETRRQMWEYEDFIQDEHATRDAVIREPDLGQFPLVAAAIAQYGEDVDFSQFPEDEELLQESTRYKGALQQWEDKQGRDRARDYVQAAFAAQNGQVALHDLYYVSPSGRTLLDTGVYLTDFPADGAKPEGHASIAKNYVVYERIDDAGLVKTDITALAERSPQEGFDLLENYFSQVKQELCYTALNGEPELLYSRGESGVCRQWMAAPDGAGVYFLVTATTGHNMGTLYYAPVRGGVLQAATTVEKNVSAMKWQFRDGILFVADGPAGESLGLAKQGKTQFLGGGKVEATAPRGDGSTLLYLDQADEDAVGNLHIYTKEDRLVGDGVSGYVYCSDDLLYFFRPSDRNQEGVDIYRWQNNRETAIDWSIMQIVGVPG